MALPLWCMAQEWSGMERGGCMPDLKEADIVGGDDHLYCSSTELSKFFDELDEFTQQAASIQGETNIEAIVNELLTGLTKKDKEIFAPYCWSI